MAMDSPLFLTRVECPICGTINENETIRVGAYTEGDRLTDFCPSSIKWRNPKYQKYHPLLFFTATCSNCYYTREFNRKFKEWGKDNNFRAFRQKVIKERHLAALASSESFIKVVGNLIDHEGYPHESAILKLLLAAYDEQLNEHPSNLDLGRFYLRIAWLFNALSGGGEDQIGSGLSPFLEDIERGIIDLDTWVAGFKRNVEYLGDAVDAYLDDWRQNHPGEESHDGYRDPLARLSDCEQTCRELIGELNASLAASKTSAGLAPTTSSGRPFHDFSDFGELLSKLTGMWDGIPRHEMDARRFALRYYIRAYEAGKEIAPGNQSIQAAYLIGELARQVGDHDTARRYFNTTIKTGQEFINEIRGDRTRTALARKILELAMKQGKKNLAEAK